MRVRICEAVCPTGATVAVSPSEWVSLGKCLGGGRQGAGSVAVLIRATQYIHGPGVLVHPGELIGESAPLAGDRAASGTPLTRSAAFGSMTRS